MNDMRRSILWVVFVFSLIMLWDKWQIHNGKSATFFPDPQMQTAAQTATPNAEPPSPAPSAAAVGVPGASQNAHAAASGVPGNPAAPAVSAAPSASMAQSNLLRPADVSAAATAVTAAPATPSSSAKTPMDCRRPLELMCPQFSREWSVEQVGQGITKSGTPYPESRLSDR